MGELTFFLGLPVKQKEDVSSLVRQTKIHVDNESAICVVKNPVYHSKTKHIEIRHHFIRDSYEKKLIEMVKIHIDYNVADLLTKAFDVTRFQFLIASIDKKELAIPGQTTTGKEFSNPLMAGSLPKTIISHELQTKAYIEQILPSPSTYQRKQRKTQKCRRTKKDTELPQTSVPLDHGADEGIDTSGSPRRQETIGVLLLRLGGYTPRSGEGRMKLDELITLCTKLSKQVLDLEKEKDAQTVEILRLMK
ncbi:hypothetical protein Tco_0593991 [Tanacetum coccineum]